MSVSLPYMTDEIRTAYRRDLLTIALTRNMPEVVIEHQARLYLESCAGGPYRLIGRLIAYAVCGRLSRFWQTVQVGAHQLALSAGWHIKMYGGIDDCACWVCEAEKALPMDDAYEEEEND